MGYISISIEVIYIFLFAVETVMEERLTANYSSYCVCSGVGLAICDRLLEDYPNVKLCLVCRSRPRAEKAMNYLRSAHPSMYILHNKMVFHYLHFQFNDLTVCWTMFIVFLFQNLFEEVTVFSFQVL